MRAYILLFLNLTCLACGSANEENLSMSGPSNPSELTGNYSITSLVNTDELSTDLTINFEDNRVYGFSGCNQYFSDFTIKDSNIYMKAIAASKKMCIDDDLNRTEQNLFKALQQVTNYKIEGDTLKLFDQDHLLIVAKRQE